MPDLARRRTKIVATVGPASREPAMLRALLLAGVDVVRLNFSHGTHPEHAAVLADVRRISEELGRHTTILGDLPGPKVRTGPLPPGIAPLRLPAGTHFFLTAIPGVASSEGVSVNYAGLPHDVVPGKALYLSDGAIRLRILSKSDDRIDTEVEIGGDINGEAGINYPDGTLGVDSVTPADFAHVAFALEHGVDWIAVSFVTSANDIERVKAAVAQAGKATPIIAKIEKHEALASIASIVNAADGIMVARGDLGIEIPLEEVPLVQKDLIARANRASKPVITATQMLQSMIASPRPTRAETTDVANAIIDGSDAVMLSAETAIGSYPLEAVAVMATIACYAEEVYPHEQLRERRMSGTAPTVGTAIANAAVDVAERLELEVIVTGTTSGTTARQIASFRPRARIVAMTPLPEIARQSSLLWGVESIVVPHYEDIDALIDVVQERVAAAGIAKPGETIAITTGMPVGEGGTNVLKLHVLK